MLKPGTLGRLDMTEMLGLVGKVIVLNMPTLVCGKCGAVTHDGSVLDRVSYALAARLLVQEALTGDEVRFLRKLLLNTQAEFADTFGVDRVTVVRWEQQGVSGVTGYGVRTRCFFRLRDASPPVAQLAALFGEPAGKKRPRAAKHSYKLDAATL